MGEVKKKKNKKERKKKKRFWPTGSGSANPLPK